MVQITGFPLSGVTEQQADWITFAQQYRTDGVIFGALNSFQVLQHSTPNMSVDITTGECFIQGVFGQLGVLTTISIAGNTSGQTRIDRVILRLDTSVNQMQLLVITGTPGAGAPGLQRSATQTDYSLAQVTVANNASSIVTANITDERTFSSSYGPIRTPNVASASTLALPGNVSPIMPCNLIVPVTGTVTISNLPAMPAGSVVTLEFQTSQCNVTNSPLRLRGNYQSIGVGSTLTLECDGLNWSEVARGPEGAPAHQYLGNNTGSLAAAAYQSIAQGDLPGAPATATNLLWNKTASGYSIQVGNATTGTEQIAGTTPQIYFATAAVTFPTAFTATPAVFLLPTTAGVLGVGAQSVTTTGFTAILNCAATGFVASKPLNWLAIGAL